jgi:hypothetical protein
MFERRVVAGRWPTMLFLVLAAWSRNLLDGANLASPLNKLEVRALDPADLGFMFGPFGGSPAGSQSWYALPPAHRGGEKKKRLLPLFVWQLGLRHGSL